MRKLVSVIMLAFLFITGASQGVFASESKEDQGIKSKTFTIEQALEVALKNSYTIKGSEYDIESADEVLKTASESVTYTPIGATPDLEAKAFLSLVNADNNWQMLKKTKTVEGDKLLLSVFNEYNNVLKALANLSYAQEALQNTQWQWNVAQLSYQTGTISQTQKNACEVLFKSAQNSLKLAEIGLETEYQAFNKLLGLNPTEKPILIEKPVYSLFKIDNLETEVNRLLEQSPSLWLLDQKVNLAKTQLELYDYTSSSRDPYKVKEINISKAQLTASESKQTLAQGVRDLYNSICNLEEKYNTQQEALKQAEDDLRVIKLMFDIGTATKTQVQTEELDLEKAKKDLNETIYQHEYSKLAFQKPWAAQ